MDAVWTLPGAVAGAGADSQTASGTETAGAQPDTGSTAPTGNFAGVRTKPVTQTTTGSALWRTAAIDSAGTSNVNGGAKATTKTAGASNVRCAWSLTRAQTHAGPGDTRTLSGTRLASRAQSMLGTRSSAATTHIDGVRVISGYERKPVSYYSKE